MGGIHFVKPIEIVSLKRTSYKLMIVNSCSGQYSFSRYFILGDPLQVALWGNTELFICHVLNVSYKHDIL